PDAAASAPGRRGCPARAATPAHTARRTIETRGSCDRSWSRDLEKPERSVGDQAARGQPAEEVRKPGQVLVAQSIIESGEVAAAIGDADARSAGGGLGQDLEVGEPPVAGGEQGVVDGAHGALVRCSARGPDGEYERQAGPALPLVAQVVAVGVDVPRGEE